MRMWMIPVFLLCRKHLLGEHGEIHKHLPSFRKGHKIHGRFYPVVQIQLKGLVARHDELAEEMVARGFNHKSPLVNVPRLRHIYPEYYDLEVDPIIAVQDLIARCPDCAENISESPVWMPVKYVEITVSKARIRA